MFRGFAIECSAVRSTPSSASHAGKRTLHVVVPKSTEKKKIVAYLTVLMVESVQLNNLENLPCHPSVRFLLSNQLTTSGREEMSKKNGKNGL